MRPAAAFWTILCICVFFALVSSPAGASQSAALTDPVGACCFSDGTCLVLTEQDCVSESGPGRAGTWLGPDTDCDPNPCPQPEGACCLPTGCCEYTSQAVCDSLGGVWYPDYTCDPSPCSPPPGACCMPDGTCIHTDQCSCGEMGGDFLPGFECFPDPCRQPTGACCNLDTGDCTLLTAEECDQQPYPHEYRGDDTTCEPNLCPTPVPTRQGTWGRIKTSYR
jgi:hypothetical protein